MTNIRNIVSRYVAKEILENFEEGSDDDVDFNDENDDEIVLSATDSDSNDELLIGYKSDDSD